MSSGPTDEGALRAATQQAVDATATAYTRDASIDVEDTLRREMAQAGMALDDDAWVREVAHAVRSGHRVDFSAPGTGARGASGSPTGDGGTGDGGTGDGGSRSSALGATQPGSMGGDNGGA